MKLKKLVCLLMAATMLVSVVGCSKPALPGEESKSSESQQESEAPPAQEDESQQEETPSAGDSGEQDFTGVTIKVWGDASLMNDDFKAYVAEHGNGLQYEVISGDEVKMMSMVASGTAADIWILSAFSHGCMYAARGLYEPLDDYIAKSDVFDESDFEGVQDLYRWDGKEVGKGPLYGIVKDWSLDNQIWVNKRVFEDAGIPIPDPHTTYSYDDIRDWAKKCVKYDDEGNQIRWGYGTTNALYQNLVAQLGSVGISLFNEDLTAVNIDTPEVREAFEYWGDMYTSKAAISDISGPGDWGGDSFANDKVGMLCCGYWFGNGNLAFLDAAKDHLEDYMLIQAPSMDPSKPADACMAGVGASIWKGSKNKDAAFRFLELYLGGEWAEKAAKNGFGNSPLTHLKDLLPQETEFQKQTFDANAYGMEHMVVFKTCPYITQQAMISVFQQYFYENLYGRMSMDDAMAGMQTEFTTLLQEGREICGVD